MLGCLGKCLHVSSMCTMHLGCVRVLASVARFAVSALDTHVFPIQAWLAILAWLSLWKQIIGQESGLE